MGRHPYSEETLYTASISFSYMVVTTLRLSLSVGPSSPPEMLIQRNESDGEVGGYGIENGKEKKEEKEKRKRLCVCDRR